MPQMFPLNWILMFIIFIAIYSASMNKIFYSPNLPTSQKDSLSLSNPLISWKW